MTVQEKKRLFGAVAIAVILWLLWHFRYLLKRNAPENSQVVSTDDGYGLTTPTITVPDFTFDLPPLSYNPNPYQPVNYDGTDYTNSKGCSFCYGKSDNALVVPQLYFPPLNNAPQTIVSPAAPRDSYNYGNTYSGVTNVGGQFVVGW